MAAASGDVDDGVSPFLDDRQELGKHVRVGRRAAIRRVPGVQVQDRRPRLGRADRRLPDLLRGQREIGRLRRDVDRPCHRTTDDHLPRRRRHHFLL